MSDNEYSGFKDLNNQELIIGDLVNVFYQDDGYNYDLVCKVHRGRMGDVQLRFERLLWEDFGHNQYPIIVHFCAECGNLDADRNGCLYIRESRKTSNSTYILKMNEGKLHL